MFILRNINEILRLCQETIVVHCFILKREAFKLPLFTKCLSRQFIDENCSIAVFNGEKLISFWLVRLFVLYTIYMNVISKIDFVGGDEEILYRSSDEVIQLKVWCNALNLKSRYGIIHYQSK